MKRKSSYMPRGFFTELFSDKKTYLAFCKVVDIEIAMDGRSYQAKVDLMEGNDQTLVFVGFTPEYLGHLIVGDIVLVAFVSGNIDAGVCVALLPSEKRKLHPKFMDGDTVILTQEGKKINLTNNIEALLEEPAVLGGELHEWIKLYTDTLIALVDKYTQLKNDLNNHTHVIQAGTVRTAGGPSSQTQVGPANVPKPNNPSSVDTSSEKDKLTEYKGDESTEKWKSNLVFIQERDKQKEEEGNNE